MAICRGKISHSIADDLFSMAHCLFGRISTQSTITEFEKEFATYTGRKYAHAYPFARTALYFTLKQLDLAPKSVVLLPSITIKAFVDVVLELDLVPKFVDSDLKTGFADLVDLEKKLKESPSVFVMTYLFGIVPNLEELIKVLEKYPTFVIEDFSQCLNGQYKDLRVGTIGNVGIYSSSAVKTVDTYGGGLLVHDQISLRSYHNVVISKLAPTSRIFLLRKIMNSSLKNLATRKVIFSLITFPFLRILQSLGSTKFERFVGNRPAAPLKKLPKDWFQKYSATQAKLGLKRLRKVNVLDAQRSKIGETFSKITLSYPSLKPEIHSKSVYWQYIVYPTNFKKFQRFFAQAGIDCAKSSLINISELPLYGWSNGTFSANWIYEHAVYIPCYAGLTQKEIDKISKRLQLYSDSGF